MSVNPSLVFQPDVIKSALNQICVADCESILADKCQKQGLEPNRPQTGDYCRNTCDSFVTNAFSGFGPESFRPFSSTYGLQETAQNYFNRGWEKAVPHNTADFDSCKPPSGPAGKEPKLVCDGEPSAANDGIPQAAFEPMAEVASVAVGVGLGAMVFLAAKSGAITGAEVGTAVNPGGGTIGGALVGAAAGALIGLGAYFLSRSPAQS